MSFDIVNCNNYIGSVRKPVCRYITLDSNEVCIITGFMLNSNLYGS